MRQVALRLVEWHILEDGNQSNKNAQDGACHMQVRLSHRQSLKRSGKALQTVIFRGEQLKKCGWHDGLLLEGVDYPNCQHVWKHGA